MRWLGEKDGFEVFILSGKQTREEVAREQERQAKRIKKKKRGPYFPCLYVGTRAGGRDTKWRKRWMNWKP